MNKNGEVKLISIRMDSFREVGTIGLLSSKDEPSINGSQEVDLSDTLHEEMEIIRISLCIIAILSIKNKHLFISICQMKWKFTFFLIDLLDVFDILWWPSGCLITIVQKLVREK